MCVIEYSKPTPTRVGDVVKAGNYGIGKVIEFLTDPNDGDQLATVEFISKGRAWCINAPVQCLQIA